MRLGLLVITFGFCAGLLGIEVTKTEKVDGARPENDPKFYSRSVPIPQRFYEDIDRPEVNGEKAITFFQEGPPISVLGDAATNFPRFNLKFFFNKNSMTAYIDKYSQDQKIIRFFDAIGLDNSNYVAFNKTFAKVFKNLGANNRYYQAGWPSESQMANYGCNQTTCGFYITHTADRRTSIDFHIYWGARTSDASINFYP